jgi:predicted dehydrogenase
MAESNRVAVLGAGPAGLLHARGYLAAGGYKLDAVVDLIPARVDAFRTEFPSARAAESVEAVLKDPGIDVISLCLPTDLHAAVAIKALRAGKHVVLESPPTLDLKGMRALLRAAEKSGSVLLPAFPRHFGSHEAAARQAIEKGYLGQPYHARAAWHRGLGRIPEGARRADQPTGWYLDPARSGGGALVDLGLPVLQVAWAMLGFPKPLSALAIAHHPLHRLPVEEAAVALVRFDDNKSIELSAAWSMHMPAGQVGLYCRVHATEGALDVYTPAGPVLLRGQPGKQKTTALKGPKLTHHAAMFRHLRALIASDNAEARLAPARQAQTLMAIVEALYRSSKSGKGTDVRDSSPAS